MADFMLATRMTMTMVIMVMVVTYSDCRASCQQALVLAAAHMDGNIYLGVGYIAYSAT